MRSQHYPEQRKRTLRLASRYSVPIYLNMRPGAGTRGDALTSYPVKGTRNRR
jgi:hypothetical protein